MACLSAKSSKVSILYHGGFDASASRRVFLFLIIAICGLMLCKTPLPVDGLGRAGENKMNYLRIGARKGSSDEAVLHGSPYTASVERPSVSFSSDLIKEEDDPEEILSVKLKLLRGKASAFRVFINLPDADERTSIIRPEFAGSYLHEPRRVKNPDFEYQETIFSIGIGDIIRDLGLTEQPSVQVTFVPCGADKALPVVLENVQIELA